MPRMDQWGDDIPEALLNIEVSRSWSDDFIEVGYDDGELDFTVEDWGTRPVLRYRRS